MHEHLFQIVDYIQSNRQNGSIVRDIITNQEFYVSGLFLDKENESGEILLFELPKARLEVVK